MVSSLDVTYDFDFSRWASPPDQLNSVSSTRLAIYNFKSSKCNGLANPFGRRRRRRLSYVQKLFLKVITQPTWWLNPSPVAVFTKILFLTEKTSSLVEPLPRVMNIAPLLSPQNVLPLPLLHPLSLRLLLLAPPTSLWLGTWRMTSSGLSKSSLRTEFFLLWLLHLFRLLSSRCSTLWRLTWAAFKSLICRHLLR